MEISFYMSSRTLLAGGDWQDYGAHCPVYLQAIKPSMFTIVKVDYLFILLLGLSSLYRLHQPLYLSVSLPYILWGCTILVFL